MAAVSNKDWKLFMERIGDWQERYMDRLNREYIAVLESDAPPSDKFWALEKRINKYKKNPGVRLTLSKEEMIFDLARLIHYKVITYDDLADFGDYVTEAVKLYLER